MIIGPDLELQGAVSTVLKASADLKTLIGDPIRLYQDVPPEAVLPYVTIGLGQVVPDLAECVDGSEVFLDLHAWSQANGWEELKKIVAQLYAAIEGATLSMTENRCLLIERYSEHRMHDSDGVTKHAVVTFRALCEPA